MRKGKVETHLRHVHTQETCGAGQSFVVEDEATSITQSGVEGVEKRDQWTMGSLLYGQSCCGDGRQGKELVVEEAIGWTASLG